MTAKQLLKTLACIVCGKRPVDLCHIRSRGAGGPDEPFNLYPGCRSHHQEQHRLGIVTFAVKYGQVWQYFKSLGWEWMEIPGGSNKLWHPRLERT